VGPGTVSDTSFAGVSTQYVVQVPVLGDITVFEQNDGDIVGVGEQVWLSWSVDHAFGIPVEETFDENDLSTRALAATVK
jgi:spermidine/putrescine transport system ATP-binding protein